GQWINNQRARKHNLTGERRQKLNDVGFVWDPFDEDWEAGFRQLKLYKEREGHCMVPQTYTAENGHPLGNWVSVQRLSRQDLSEARLQRLDELGFVWDAREAGWDEGFAHLKLYKKREGHCRVPVNHKESDGFPLGRWVLKQRQRRETLSEVRLQRLNYVGFDWAPLETTWEEGLRHLKLYKEREGHCRVPVSHEETASLLVGGCFVNAKAKIAYGLNVANDWTNLDLFGA